MQPVPLVTLIGDPEENFYQLGVKDREAHADVLRHMQGQLRLPFPAMDLVARKALQGALRPVMDSGKFFSPLLKSYAEGLGRPWEEIGHALLVPEVLSCLGAWPNMFPKGMLGCSSFFCLEADTQAPLHGRILDFPLVGNYDRHERAMLMRFTNMPEIFSFGSAGFPYPSLTAMNSHGMTLALHQKFTRVFETKGMSIFEIAYGLLAEAHTPEAALRYLRRSVSLTTWGVNLAFKDGTVLICDLRGSDLRYKEHHLEEGVPLYVNNMTMETLPGDGQSPPGMENYCATRQRASMKKLQKAGDKLSAADLLELMATPLQQDKVALEDWEWDSLTPSSLAISVMSPKDGRALFVPGPGPKVHMGQHFEWDAWSGAPGKLHGRARTPKGRAQAQLDGFRHFAQAVAADDLGDAHGAYHHMQMAKAGYAEGGCREEAVAELFFLVYQFLHERHTKVRFQALSALRELEGKLPAYLECHRKLFIYRYERILMGESSLKEEDIGHPQLAIAFRRESKFPNVGLHSLVAQLIRPRPDILDIVYLHAL